MISVHFYDILDIYHGPCTWRWDITTINIWYDKYHSCLFIYEYRDPFEYCDFLDLLFCHEIKTVFITNFHGIINNRINNSIYDILNSDYIKDIIKEFYGYKIMIYNKGYFMKIKNEFINNITLKCNLFSNIFPKDIINSIRDNMLPEWTKYHRHYVKNKYYKQFIIIKNYNYDFIRRKNWPKYDFL